MPERSTATRAIALVGPGGAGKTSLAEALLHAAGAVPRQGSVDAGTSVGDSSPEAQARRGSTELNLMHFEFLGDSFALADCPGAGGFVADGALAVAAADLAIVVVDPDPDRAALAEPTLRQLEALGVPHLIFVNRIDQARGRIRDLLVALQPLSKAPLIARQIPVREGERVTGFIELALERAFTYRAGQPSERTEIPAGLAEREAADRNHMIEQLADHDDALLEALLMDETPDQHRILADLARETREGLGVPLLFGSATNGFGVRRLLKALRHEAPYPDAAMERLGASMKDALVLKISHGNAIGRLAVARLFGAGFAEGAEASASDGASGRLGTLLAVQGAKTSKIDKPRAGAIVAIAKLDSARAGEWLGLGGKPPSAPSIDRPPANHALAITPRNRNDDVKLSTALRKLLEEDVSLHLIQVEEQHEMRLIGVGDEHLAAALARLKRRYGVEVDTRPPTVDYKESIRGSVTRRGRHKKQSGGHGQYGDVVIEVAPRARGDGFAFFDQISGGAIPRQWIPAVEHGVRDAMVKGPLGFPVVDVAVTLSDGSYHSVDSSELAFRTAGRIAMSDALAAASPHLLEPMHRVTIVAPAAATSRITSAIASRRGQMLGIEPREGWHRWDVVEAMLPEAALHGLDADLRSMSQGLASYTAAFDHLAEINGKLAQEVVHAHLEPA